MPAEVPGDGAAAIETTRVILLTLGGSIGIFGAVSINGPGEDTWPAPETTMRKYCYSIMLVLGLLTAPLAQAQSDEKDIGELSVYSGGAFGDGTHAFVGGGAGYAFARYGIGLFNVSFSPLGNDTLRHLPGLDSKGSHLYDFNYSIHIRYPINSQWAPYGIVGPSVIWNGYSYGVVGANGVRIYVHKDDANFGFHTGAGVRYHVNDHWGVRPEAQVVISARTYLVLSVGFFFNVGPEW
jgi:hypothetical protein